MWWWVLLWSALVVSALVFLGLVVWGLVKRIIELGREIGRSADRLTPAFEQVTESYRPARSVLSEPPATPPRRPRRGRTGAGARHRRRRGVG